MLSVGETLQANTQIQLSALLLKSLYSLFDLCSWSFLGLCSSFVCLAACSANSHFLSLFAQTIDQLEVRNLHKGRDPALCWDSHCIIQCFFQHALLGKRTLMVASSLSHHLLKPPPSSACQGDVCWVCRLSILLLDIQVQSIVFSSQEEACQKSYRRILLL